MHIHAFTILVPDYDAGLTFYADGLGFDLAEDVDMGQGKRWIRVTPPGGGVSVILARATTDAQVTAIGAQTGDRVGFFLQSDDFATDHARLVAAGAVFEESPRYEPYGTVAVWRDPFGNRWDLLQLKS